MRWGQGILWEKKWKIMPWTVAWCTSIKGRWTFRLNPILDVWSERKHFCLTQFLTAHGYYRTYLYKYGYGRDEAFPECRNVSETAEHVLNVLYTVTLWLNGSSSWIMGLGEAEQKGESTMGLISTLPKYYLIVDSEGIYKWVKTKFGYPVSFKDYLSLARSN